MRVEISEEHGQLTLTFKGKTLQSLSSLLLPHTDQNLDTWPPLITKDMRKTVIILISHVSSKESVTIEKQNNGYGRQPVVLFTFLWVQLFMHINNELECKHTLSVH